MDGNSEDIVAVCAFCCASKQPIAHCVCAVLGSPGGGGTQVPNCSGSCRSSIPGWQNCVFCGLLIWGPPEEAEGLLHVPGPVSFSSHAVLACMVMALTKSSCLTATFFLHRLCQFKRSCAISFVQVGHAGISQCHSRSCHVFQLFLLSMDSLLSFKAFQQQCRC